MYVDLNTEKTVSLAELLRRNPLVSLPDNPDDASLALVNAARILPAPRPAGDVVTPDEPERREDGKWYQTWEVRSFTGGELAQRLEDRRNELLAAVTARRWEVETGGITLPDGVRVATAIEDQNRLTSVVANARLAGVETVDYKAASGWVTLTVDELESVAAAIALHVQACFSAERAHHQAIELLDEQGMAGYDIDAGWPPNASETPT